MQNKPTMLPSKGLSTPQSVNDYRDPSISERRWELTLNWKTKVYLTDEERSYYLAQIKAGKKIIGVGDLVLTRRFDCMIPIRDKPKKVSQEELDRVVEKERRRMKGL